MPAPAELPIAVFDSGVGGLTVVAALNRLLPDETIAYLGDTARLPYGTKSAEVVRRYARRCADHLLRAGAKLLIVACNTASAHALPQLQADLALPVLGVIAPGAAAAVAAGPGPIGVLATEGTILSGAYPRAIAALAPAVQVATAAAPLLVPLAEEGLADHPASELLARDYLAPLTAANVRTLLLGCTHYPLLQPTLRRILGPSISLVDSATATAAAAAALLDRHGLRAARRLGPDAFAATDIGERLHRIGSLFLGRRLPPVSWVDLMG